MAISPSKAHKIALYSPPNFNRPAVAEHSSATHVSERAHLAHNNAEFRSAPTGLLPVILAYGGGLRPTRMEATPPFTGENLTFAVGSVFSKAPRALPAGVLSSTMQISPYGGGETIPEKLFRTFQPESLSTFRMSSAKVVASFSPSCSSPTTEPLYGIRTETNSSCCLDVILRGAIRSSILTRAILSSSAVLFSRAVSFSAFAARSFAWAIWSRKPSAFWSASPAFLVRPAISSFRDSSCLFLAGPARKSPSNSPATPITTKRAARFFPLSIQRRSVLSSTVLSSRVSSIAIYCLALLWIIFRKRRRHCPFVFVRRKGPAGAEHSSATHVSEPAHLAHNNAELRSAPTRLKIPSY